MFFDKFPYTNLHNVNLDWVLQKVKEWGAMVEDNNQRFEDLQAAYTAFSEWLTSDYNNFKDYVTGYLENLDVQQEINNKLDDMFRSGQLETYLQPYVSTSISTWLEENITPTTPAVDTSLTVAGAAADAKATGDAIHDLEDSISSISLSGNFKTALLTCFQNVAWINANGQTYYDDLFSALYPPKIVSGADLTWVNGYPGADGSIMPGGGAVTSDFIGGVDGYTNITFVAPGATSLRLAFYDQNQALISRYTTGGQTTLPANTYFVRVTAIGITAADARNSTTTFTA